MTGEGTPQGAPESGGQALSWMLMSAIQHFVAGRADEAEADCERILRIAPDHPEALNLAGMLATRQGRFERAADLLARATAASPAFALAWFNLGAALQSLGREGEAIEAYRRARALNPQHLETVFNLGNLLAGAGRFGEAVEAYEQARALGPTVPQVHNNLGNALTSLGRADEAIAALKAAIALDPCNADTRVNLANALQTAGDHAGAVEATTDALAIDPANASAWFVRSELKTFRLGDGEIAQLEALIAADDPPRLDPAARINLQFALAKALMDAGEVDPGFACLEAANRLKRATFAYDVEDDVRGFEVLAEVFDRPMLDRFAGAGDATDAPIFVLGMPRSGTTLVEQILASHPAVHGAGELDALMDAVGEVFGPDLPLEALAHRLAGLTAADAEAIAARYLRAARSAAGTARRFTDKMPANFRLIGLIGLILPGARIVHCARDPIDTCFSCYTKQFSGRQDFAYDLSELGTYYRAYAGLMDHWRAVMPADRLLDVSYEALVEDLDGQARRLVRFCGHDWDDACLSFHSQPRSVRTASASQVRRPIYRSSLERWRPYERHLLPLIEALRAHRPRGTVRGPEEL